MRYKLGDICTVVSGSTPKTGIPEYWDGDIKWITPAELSDDSYIVNDSVRHITELGVQKTRLAPFPEGTVLLSSRAPIGKVAIAGCEMYCNQGFKNLICSEKINNRYLYWFLKGNTEYLNSLGRGATFKEISKQIVSAIEINVPDMKTQIEAVEVLEKISGLIRIRRQELQQLDELIKARFVEMFGNPDLERTQKGWRQIGSIGTVVGGATPKTSVDEYWDGEYRWITPAELDNASGYIYDSTRKLTEEGVKSCSLTEMPIGTVILSSRAPIGKVAIAGKTFYCNQGFKNIICDDEILPVFLYSLLLMNSDYLNSLGRGATFKEISKSIVENIKIPVPPIELQEQFVTFVSQVDKSKITVQRALNEVKELFDSLMQQYFS